MNVRIATDGDDIAALRLHDAAALATAHAAGDEAGYRDAPYGYTACPYTAGLADEWRRGWQYGYGQRMREYGS